MHFFKRTGRSLILGCLLAFAVAAPLVAFADDTLANNPQTLLTNYWAPGSATTLICTNVTPAPNNMAGASWKFGRALLETLSLTIVSTNAGTEDVNVIISPSVWGHNTDHTVNFFKFKATLAGTTPVTVTTNVPAGFIGGAIYGMVYSVQNAHASPIKLELTRSGWNK